MSKPDTLAPNRRASPAPLRARWLFAAIAALGAGFAAGAVPLQAIEECIETGTRAVSLPSGSQGSLSAVACAGCASLRLKFDSDTRFFVGRQAVSYTKFRQAAGKTDLRLDVYYDPKTRILTRLRIPAGAATQ